MPSRRPIPLAGAAALFAVLATACTDVPDAITGTDDVLATGQRGPAAANYDGPFALTAPVFDIGAAPDGSILFAEFNVVKEIRGGEINDVMEVPTVSGSAVNGLAASGRRSYFATSAGLDLAVGAGLWHVSDGRARLVGDIEAFESASDPDANEGPMWKAPICETLAEFSEGPQSNPYHVTGLTGGTALVADAAGNTVLEVTKSGKIDWVAVLTPPTLTGDGSTDPADWIPGGAVGSTACYAQPVPTAVAVAPDGDYYVGELTGVTPGDFGAPLPNTGLSRVWRIDAGARNVTCPSPACEVAFSGFTSVIDVAFGPDGDLYVVEYDEANWFTAIEIGSPTTGTLNRCDLDGGTCTEEETGLTLPSAITFDKWGNLWLLENNIIAPVVREIDL